MNNASLRTVVAFGRMSPERRDRDIEQRQDWHEISFQRGAPEHRDDQRLHEGRPRRRSPSRDDRKIAVRFQARTIAIGPDDVQVRKEEVVYAANQRDTKTHGMQLKSYVVVRELGIPKHMAGTLIQIRKPEEQLQSPAP